MNIRHSTRTTLILSLCIATLAVTAFYEHNRLSNLRPSLTDTPVEASLDSLQSRLAIIDERLTAQDNRRTVHAEDYRVSQQALSSRLDAVEAQARDFNQALSQALVASQDLAMLKASVEALDIRLTDFQQAQSMREGASRAPYTPSSKPGQPPKAKPNPPPFTAIGIEHRGGQQFLSVAPIGSTALHQIHLIRIGDTVPGTAWTLRSVDADAAKFDVAGASRTLPITP